MFIVFISLPQSKCEIVLLVNVSIAEQFYYKIIVLKLLTPSPSKQLTFYTGSQCFGGLRKKTGRYVTFAEQLLEGVSGQRAADLQPL